MSDVVDSVHTVDDLRLYVHSRLCQKENLVADQFRLDETTLFRGQSPCGLQFFLHGPRNVKLSAVWAADQNTLFLYDSKGERFSRLRLGTQLSLTPLAKVA
jgi:hypothetical protein